MTLYSTALTIYKLWDVQWVQFVLQHTLIFFMTQFEELANLYYF